MRRTRTCMRLHGTMDDSVRLEFFRSGHFKLVVKNDKSSREAQEKKMISGQLGDSVYETLQSHDQT